jgi:hypothetical protein
MSREAWELDSSRDWEQCSAAWLPIGAEYTGVRHVVWDWYLAEVIVVVFRAYANPQAAAAYHQKVSLEAAPFGGMARRLGVRRMTYNKVLKKGRVYDPTNGKSIKMPSNDGCSAISWARASLMFFEAV